MLLFEYILTVITKFQAFLEHGLPSTTEKLLALMNKVYANVSTPKKHNKIITNVTIIIEFLWGICNSSGRQAAFNVGGIVLNALAIEHFILRHPSGTKYVSDTRFVVHRCNIYTSKQLLSVHEVYININWIIMCSFWSLWTRRKCCFNMPMG